ncbi:MAG: DUF5103 domain-containing protein [Balneolaceae bacterium]|nr:MAG: DUF5103 domain-containing protein [Balneolaceae bacterium]
MFLKALLIFKLLILIVLTGCSTREALTDNNRGRQPGLPVLENSFIVQDQKVPSEEFRSIQFYAGANPATAPIIKIGTGETFTLRFDHLSASNEMFTVRAEHRNADWSESNLFEGFYMRGQSTDFISDPVQSTAVAPNYMHYTYRFPNRTFNFLISGNYLLHVEDYRTGELLFSVPFMLYEDQGSIEFFIEELFGLDSRHFLHHQPFATYIHPDFVMMPDQDISIYFVQNQFWGRAREATIRDLSESDRIRMHVSREDAFPGRYEFRPLRMQNIDNLPTDFLEVRKDTEPPTIIRDRDVINFGATPLSLGSNRYGSPVSDRDARYARVVFYLDKPDNISAGSSIHVTGAFSNWSVTENNRMRYNRDTNQFEAAILVKEGLYDYKYVIIEGRTLDDLRLTDSFADSRQEYHTLIYYRDLQLNADRLLNIRSDFTR